MSLFILSVQNDCSFIYVFLSLATIVVAALTWFITYLFTAKSYEFKTRPLIKINDFQIYYSPQKEALNISMPYYNFGNTLADNIKIKLKVYSNNQYVEEETYSDEMLPPSAPNHFVEYVFIKKLNDSVFSENSEIKIDIYIVYDGFNKKGYCCYESYNHNNKSQKIKRLQSNWNYKISSRKKHKRQ